MSQAVIGNLRANLGLDTAAFTAGAKKAQASLAGLSASFKSFALAAAGTLTLAGVATSLKTAINRMDELGKAAQKIGIPVEQLSTLEYAARLADVPLEALTTTMSRFARSLSEIGAGGSNEAGAALQALGVSAVDAQGRLRPTADILLDIAEEFSAMKDGADKTALSMALFGKSGADMVPFLNQGRMAIKDLTDEARIFGLEVTPEAARSAEQFNDNLTRLQGASEGLQRELAKQLTPALADTTEALLDYVKNGDLIEGAVKGIATEFGDLARLADAAAGSLDRLSSYSKWLDEFARKYGPFSSNVQNGFFGIFGDAQTVAPGKGDLLRLKASQDMIADMLGSIDNFGGRRPGGGGGGGGGAQEVIPITLFDIRGPATALEDFNQRLNESNLLVGELSFGLSGQLSSGLAEIAFSAENAGDAFSMLRNTALGALQDITQKLLDRGLQMLLEALVKGLAGAAGGGGFGGGGFGGFYANGGTLGAGKWGIAGEAGPEIIHGPARITPMERRRGAVNVQIINNTPAKVSTQTEENPDGSVNIRALIQDEVLDTLGSGRAARVMGARYGARVAARRT